MTKIDGAQSILLHKKGRNNAAHQEDKYLLPSLSTSREKGGMDARRDCSLPVGLRYLQLLASTLVGNQCALSIISAQIIFIIISEQTWKFHLGATCFNILWTS